MDGLTILLKAKDEASKVFDRVRGSMSSLKNASVDLLKNGFETMGDGFKKVATGLMIGIPLLSAGLFGLTKQAISNASAFETQGVVLELIATRYGQSAEKAKELAQVLGKDLRIGSGSASESLQYLIKSGLSLDQAGDLIKRFTNEAITGRSSSISLADAVKNLAFAYTTGNSALGNMSGISENFSDIEARGLRILQKKGQLLGLTIGQLNEAQKMQARYSGMIDLTNDTMGASNRLLGSSSDLYSILSYNLQQISLQVGQKLEPAYKALLKQLIKFTDKIDIQKIYDKVISFFSKLNTKLQPVIDLFNQFNTNGQLTNSIIAGLGGTAMILLIGGFTALAGAVIAATWPFALLAGAISLLWLAWERNFGNIQGKVQEVFGWFKDNILPLVIDKLRELRDELLEVKTKFQELGGVTGIMDKIKEKSQTTFEDLKVKIQTTFDEIKTKVQTTFNDIISYFQTTFAPEIQTVNTYVDSLKNTWENIVFTWNNVILPALIILGGFLLWLGSNIIQALIYAWEKLRQPVNDFITAIFELLKPLGDLLPPVMGLISGLLLAFAGFIGVVIVPVIQVLWAWFILVFEGILQVVTGVIKIITGILNLFIGFVKGVFSGDFSQAIEGLKQIWEGLGSFFQGAINLVLSPFKSISDGIINTIKSIDLLQAGKDIIQSLINGLGSMLESLQSKASEIGSSITSSIGNIGANIKIPGFAKGVSNFGGGLAMVGEQGPELVNLPKGSSVTTARDTEKLFEGDSQNQQSGSSQNQSPAINIVNNIEYKGMSKPSKTEQIEMTEALAFGLEKLLKQYKLI